MCSPSLVILLVQSHNLLAALPSTPEIRTGPLPLAMFLLCLGDPLDL